MRNHGRRCVFCGNGALCRPSARLTAVVGVGLVAWPREPSQVDDANTSAMRGKFDTAIACLDARGVKLHEDRCVRACAAGRVEPPRLGSVRGLPPWCCRRGGGRRRPPRRALSVPCGRAAHAPKRGCRRRAQRKVLVAVSWRLHRAILVAAPQGVGLRANCRLRDMPIHVRNYEPPVRGQQSPCNCPPWSIARWQSMCCCKRH